MLDGTSPTSKVLRLLAKKVACRAACDQAAARYLFQNNNKWKLSQCCCENNAMLVFEILSSCFRLPCLG